MTEDSSGNTPDRSSPNLSLGEPPKRLAAISRGISRGWLWSLLGLQLVVVAILIADRMGVTGVQQPVSSSGIPVAELKSVAIALEERSLYAEAADAWEAYLRANPNSDDRPQILLRAGRLATRAEVFPQAVKLLIQAEQSAAGDKELTDKTGPLLIECLRRMGHYGEVGRELSRRVEAGTQPDDTGTVLATIAGEDFTQADLDRLIERRVDQMLSMSGTTADATQRNALLEQMSGAETRRRLLQEFLQTELFSRRARELKMDHEDEFLESQRMLVENLLSSRLLARELDTIQPTDVDLEAHYQTHRDQYQQPASMAVLLLNVADSEAGQAQLKKITSAQDFVSQVLAQSPGIETQADLPRHRIVAGSRDVKLGDTKALFELAEQEWTQTVHMTPDGTCYLVLCDRKQASRLPALAEVRQRVAADYQNRKRRELTQKLFDDLLKRYEVEIRPNPPAENEPPADNEPPAGKSQSSTKQDDGS